MAEQDLDLPDIHPAFKKVGGEGMSKAMDGDLFGDTCLIPRLVEDPQNRATGQMPLGDLAWKKPATGPYGLPVLAKHSEKLGRKHDVTVLPALALLDAKRHSLTIDVSDTQIDDLRNPKSPGVSGHQDSSVLDIRRRFQ